MLSILLLLISCGNNNSYNSSNHSSYYNGAPEGKLLFSTLQIPLILILIFFSLLLPTITAGIIASKEQLNVEHWIVASLFLGWIAVFILALLIKPKDNIIIPKTRVYKKYACERCGELINTQKCGYCGFENNTEDLTENTTNVFGISK